MIIQGNYETTIKFHPNIEELVNDIAKIYQEVIKHFYDSGYRNLQFDDYKWVV